MNDPLRELLKQKVRDMLSTQLDSVVSEVLAETLGTRAQAPAAPVEVVRGKRKHSQKFPSRTVIHVNQTYFGAPAGAATQTGQAWGILRQHLGTESRDRTEVAIELGQLMNVSNSQASSFISRLLQEGALVVDSKQGDRSHG